MILFLAFSVVVFTIIISWIYLIWDAKTSDIAGPFPLPLIGNGHYFVVKQNEFLDLLERLHKMYGKAVRIHLLSSRYVFLYHPKYIEAIVSNSEIITKGRSYNFLRAWLGEGLLTSTGSKWRAHRKFLTPAFHFNILQNFLPVFCKNEKILKENLTKYADGETDLDLFPVIALAALDNVTESIMGMSFNAQRDRESKYVKAIIQLSSIVALRMRNPFIALEGVFNLSPYKKVQDKALKIIHGHTKKVIQVRRDELKKANITTLVGDTDIGIRNKHAFLDLLLLSEIDGKKINDDLLREEVDTFLFEGHDTTTSAISFTLFCLSRHKEVQDKVFAEQKTIFCDNFERDATFSELHQMKYLELVIKESLRLFPSVPLFERMVTKDVEIGGIKLKKNTSVVIDIFHMQRLPEFYEDPLEFRPERFDTTNVRNPFSWLAFSAGPRNCIEFFNLLERIHNTYGKLARIHLLSSRYIILYHPKNIEAIVTNSEIITKGRSYNFLRAWLGEGLLTSTGSKWRKHRKFLTPAFHFNILQNFLPVFWKNEKILQENLTNYADGETDLNLFPIIALAALDNVTESIMGMSFNAQRDRESKYVKAIIELSSIVALRMRNPFFTLEAIFNLSPYKKVQNKALSIIHGHTKKVIQVRRNELKKANITTLVGDTDFGIKNKHAFLDLLLLSEIDGSKINDESIREEVDTFLFEGHDTSTSAICFTLFCLSRHKEVQDKVFAEQKSIFCDNFNRDATYSELNQMKYLEMVIKESLRLYPSVPLIERMVTKDVEVGGMKLKKNTSVVIDIFHMQRLPELYEDPLEFRPERFDTTNVRNPFSWLAFSAGPRNCIGQKFAMMELKVTLSGIIRHFELLPSTKEPDFVFDLILKTSKGVHIKLKPRVL